jgi:protein disulfide-isomerase
MKKFAAIGLFLLAIMVSTFCVGAEIRWETDYKKASQQADTSGKPMFVLFTGSDWCYWCKRLENDILQNPQFSSAVGDKFIFVMMDFPKGRPQDPALASQNQQIADKYNVTGFPTVIILDSKGQYLGKPSYDKDDPQGFANKVLQNVR